MSLSIIRRPIVLRARRTPLSLGYRPLTISTPSIRFLTIQPITNRAFSTSLIRLNSESKNVPQQEKLTIGARIGRFYQNSKDLIRFYKDGLKLIWANKKQMKLLEQKVAQEGYELSRSEFQLVHHTKKDVVKLIPFGIIFLILPESIPLWVIYAPSMIPSTCLTEKQILKQRQKLDKERQKMTRNVLKSVEDVQAITPEDFLTRSKFIRIAKQYDYDFDLSRIDRRHLSPYCRFMGISDFGMQFMLKNRLNKYMQYIEKDDQLLVKENLVDKLSLKELSDACEERGMKSVNEQEENMRRGLKYWLSLTQPENPVEKISSPGILVFSRMFLLNANYLGRK